MRQPTLNGTTITGKSILDFNEEKVNVAFEIIKEVNSGNFLKRGESKMDFIWKKLDYHELSMEVLLTTQNHIDENLHPSLKTYRK
jgi:hypothetical protein